MAMTHAEKQHADASQQSDQQQRPNPMQHILQFAAGYVPSAALWIATELNIADLLRDGGKSVSELAKSTHTNEDALYRILRLLAMVGIFDETRPRQFAHTPASELLRSDAPDSMRDTVSWIADPFHFNIAGELLHSVRTGQPTIEHVTGKPVFEYFPTDALEFDRFHRAMTNLSAMAIGPVLDSYDFSSFKTVVDVAGGHAFILCSILQKYPEMEGILFDLEGVVPGAQQRIAQLGLANRCRTESGDFFKAVPNGGDLYLMKSIIHDWDDDRAVAILRNCGRALQGKRDGKIILLEFVVPPGNQPHPSKIIDIEMLMFPGGRERTADEYSQLFSKAGLRLTRIIPTKSPFSVIEGQVAS